MPLTLPSDLAAAQASLAHPGASGEPEDPLRAPCERLRADLAERCGLPRNAVAAVGGSSVCDRKTRPDYAVTVHQALVGFIALKTPGKGTDPRKFKDPHDHAQWEKLHSLPKLVDLVRLHQNPVGAEVTRLDFAADHSLSRNLAASFGVPASAGGARDTLKRGHQTAGSWPRRPATDRGILLTSSPTEVKAPPVSTLVGDLESAGPKRQAPPDLLGLFEKLLRWEPIPPRTAGNLARLCRRLREGVTAQLALRGKAFTSLAVDWRKLRFPAIIPTP